MTRILVCDNCAAPLPRPRAGEALVTCAFCGATTDLLSGNPGPSVQRLTTVSVKERLGPQLAAFEQAYRQGVTGGQGPLDAFRAAAARALHDICDPDSITNVVFGIASDFDREHGTEITRDPNAIPRLATAYIDSIEQLSQHLDHEINIPFLTTTSAGPVHFMQRVTKDYLKELAARPAAIAPREAPDPTAPTPAAEKARKPWWKKFLG